MRISLSVIPTAAFSLLWNQQLTQYLSVQLKAMVDAINANYDEIAGTGRVTLAPTQTPLMGELLCDNKLYKRADYPELFKVIGTQFGIAGDPSTDFRVPLMYDPATGVQYRIKTGR